MRPRQTFEDHVNAGPTVAFTAILAGTGGVREDDLFRSCGTSRLPLRPQDTHNVRAGLYVNLCRAWKGQRRLSRLLGLAQIRLCY